MGLYPNFRFVAGRARGKYFVWRAADDEIAPTFLEEAIAAFDADQNLSLVFPRSVAIGPHGERLHSYEWLQPGRHDSGDPGERFKRLYSEFGLRDVWNEPNSSGMKQWGGSAPLYIFAMMRTDIMRKARPLGSHMRADETFICQTCLWGQMRELQGGLSRIRIHEEAASRLVVEWNPSEWQKVQDPESAVGFRLWIATHWWHAEHMLCVWSAPIPIRTKLKLWAFITGKITVRLRRKLALRSS